MPSLRNTETRHHPDGKTCHHFFFHGLTCDQYDDLLDRANGCCEICGVAGKETPRGFLVVDHYHGKKVASFIRGMLCDYCNGTVMACVDGLKVWGPVSRKWEAKGREYEANSWQRPTPAQLTEMAERTEKPPKNPPRRMPTRDTLTSITLPARKGVPAMAECLFRWLTPDELAELTALLSVAADDS